MRTRTTSSAPPAYLTSSATLKKWSDIRRLNLGIVTLEYVHDAGESGVSADNDRGPSADPQLLLDHVSMSRRDPVQHVQPEQVVDQRNDVRLVHGRLIQSRSQLL
jgi:hypothetical protein